MALMAKHWENNAIAKPRCSGGVSSITASVAPLAGGALLDLQNNGLLLWLLMGGACLVVLPTLRSLKPRYGVTETGQDIAPPEQQRFDALAGSSGQQTSLRADGRGLRPSEDQEKAIPQLDAEDKY